MPILCLNLGCGEKALPSSADERWTNLDSTEFAGVDVVHDLNHPLPFEDESFDYILLDNVLEHFERPAAVRLINEMDRVLVDQGKAKIVVPHWASQAQWQDPTHISAWPPRAALYWNQTQTRYGGRRVGVTANFYADKIKESGSKKREAFVTFFLSKKVPKP